MAKSIKTLRIEADEIKLDGFLKEWAWRSNEKSPSDWFFVSLDIYGDYRTVFEFWLNSEGVKREIRW